LGFCLILWPGWPFIPNLYLRPVCPTYLSGLSLHFNRYILLCLYVYVVISLGFRRFRVVLVVWNVTLILMFLNSFEIVLVSGP
jgi:hypothetical protein